MSLSYREAGTGDHARSTVLGKTSALNHFVTENVIMSDLKKNKKHKHPLEKGKKLG